MPNLRTASTATAVAQPGTAAAAAAASLTVRGVHKSFGDTAVLRGVDLDAPAGALVALLGPSGCGKTTLLRTVAGLERPDRGEIRLGGTVLSDAQRFVAPERRRIGMVFQDWALFPHLSVYRNVGFGLSRAQRRAGRVEAALALVELAGLAQRLPATLSGGQQQRVALARALASQPALILLDEPFSNLDAALRATIRREVHGLLRHLTVTAVFVTHDQEEAFLLGDEVAVMLDGRIQQQAAPAQVYDLPSTRAVAAFVGDANFVPGVACGRQADTCVGPVPLRAASSGPVDALVRPEWLQVTAAPDRARAGTDRAWAGHVGVVQRVEYYGHDAVYLIRPQDGPTVRARVIAAPAFHAGDRVRVRYAGGPTTVYPRG